MTSDTSRRTSPRLPGSYFTGDGARWDADGYYWLMGRVDDVINVSGHRLGTMEIESALVAHPKVAEAAVVGRPDDLKGQAIAAFVTLDEGYARATRCARSCASGLRRRLARWPGRTICASPRCCPRRVQGKIMRRLLRELATTGRP
jgi:acetyl-CoA synthetase